ncbi:hypothetical protein TcCL_NonESM05437, partial [Trypanosoma cruzi]
GWNFSSRCFHGSLGEAMTAAAPLWRSRCLARRLSLQLGRTFRNPFCTGAETPCGSEFKRFLGARRSTSSASMTVEKLKKITSLPRAERNCRIFPKQ